MQNGPELRADAARNIAAVIETGARLLAEDPGASLAAIAAQAGVDRRTVYRHFECREALVNAVHRAVLDAADDVADQARLESAPVLVALHRLVEGLVAVIRRFSIDPARLGSDTELAGRRLEHRQRLEAFLRRAADEGLIRPDLPDGLALELVLQTVGVLARQFGQLAPGPAADLVVDLLQHGLGQPQPVPGRQ